MTTFDPHQQQRPGRLPTTAGRMAPSPSTWLTAMLCLLLLLSPELVLSFVVLSRHSTQLALDSNLDSTSNRLLTTGVLFRTAFKDFTLQGASDTDCYIALGDARGFDRVLYETPQLCTHFEIFPRASAADDSNSNSNSDTGGLLTSLPTGISMGMYGDQPMMATVDFSGEYTDLPLTNPYNLPFQTFPVGVTSEASGGVYVGLQGTGGRLPPAAAKESSQDLQNIYDYYKQMTHPTLMDHDTNPQVVKVNMRTQELEWQLDLETTEGRSTIGNVVHIPSRDLLVVVGSSNGKGSTVGAGAWSNSWDGYVTLVNATTGVADDSAGSETHLAADHSIRVQSQVGQDDYILGACASDDNLFILGMTTGQLKPTTDEFTKSGGGAFAMMLDIDTLTIQWTQQWYGAGTEALKCVATSSNLYVAGQVPEGVSLLEDLTRTADTPSRDQDLFFSLLDTADGNARWTSQLDSRRADHLADIQVTQVGDFLFTGNSMDFEVGIVDLYTASMNFADGFYDWRGLAPDADPIRGDTNQGNGETLPPGIFNQLEQIVDDDDNKTTVIVVATVVPCVFLLGVILCGFYYKKRSPPSSSSSAAAAETKEEDPRGPETSTVGAAGGASVV
jgi:hypothetical protein